MFSGKEDRSENWISNVEITGNLWTTAVSVERVVMEATGGGEKRRRDSESNIWTFNKSWKREWNQGIIINQK